MKRITWPILCFSLTAVFGLVPCLGESAALAQQDADDLLGDIADVPDVERKKEPAKREAPPASTEDLSLGAKKKSQVVLEPEAESPKTTAGAVDLIKAVPRKRMLKRRRVELAGMVSMSLNDPYFQHFAGSAAAVFYPHDAFGFGLGVDVMFEPVKRSSVDVVRRGATSVLGVLEHPDYLTHLDLHWVPIVGKVSLFDSLIVHFDLFATAGFGAAISGDRRLPSATFSIGQRYVLGDWLALRLEVRDHLFLDSQEADRRPRSDIQNYVMFMVGASVFVPPSFEYTYR